MPTFKLNRGLVPFFLALIALFGFPNRVYCEDGSTSQSATSQQSNVEEVKEVQMILEKCKRSFDEISPPTQECKDSHTAALEEKEMEFSKKRQKKCSGEKSFSKFCYNWGNGFVNNVIREPIYAFLATKCQAYVLHYMGNSISGAVSGIQNSPTVGKASDATANPATPPTPTLANQTQQLGNQSLQTEQFKIAMTAIGKLVDNTVNAWKSCTMSEAEGLAVLDQELRKERPKNLPDDIQHKVKDIDRDLDEIFLYQKRERAQGNGPTFNADPVIDKIKLRELVYLQMSGKGKDISASSLEMTPEQKTGMAQKIKDLLDEYPEHKSNFKALINLIRDDSARGDSAPVSGSNRVQFFLYGPPGTGKTTFAKKLSKTLEMPICDLRAEDFQITNGKTIAKGINYSWGGVSDTNYPDLFGKLGECYRIAQGPNFMLLLDELGETMGGDDPSSEKAGNGVAEMQKQMLIAEFNKMLSEDSKTIEFPGLGIRLPMPKVIVGTGNKRLTNPALLTKMPTYDFLKLDPKIKALALTAGYYESLKKKKPRLSEEQFKTLKETTDQYLEFIYNEDQAFPGGRVVKTVIENLIGLVASELDEPLPQRSTKMQIETFIQDAFNRSKTQQMKHSTAHKDSIEKDSTEGTDAQSTIDSETGSSDTGE